MRKKWILIGASVGLLTLAITGGVALAWGPGIGGIGFGGGSDSKSEYRTALAQKLTELQSDGQITADDILQAENEIREEAQAAQVQDLADRVAETLGTDPQATADAITQAAEEMASENLESRLQAAIDSGRLTEEQAQEYRDQAADGLWHGFSGRFKSGDVEEFANRVGAILDVSGDEVADALDQAMNDIMSEAMESRIQEALDSGRITEGEADALRERIASGDWKGFGRDGHKGGRHGGRHGHHHGGDRHWFEDGDSDGDLDSDYIPAPAPAGNGDSA